MVLALSSLITGLASSATSQPLAPRGLILDSYRTSARAAAPSWARVAISRAREQVDPRSGALATRSVDLDDLGMRHVRFTQTHGGVPVFGGQVIAHLDASGRLSSRTGHLYRVTGAPARPSITAARAIGIARRALGYTGTFASPPAAKLTLLPLGPRRLLTYQVSLEIEDGTEATAHHQYFINARSGKVAWHYDSLPHEDVVGTGRSLYSGTVNIHADLVGGSYELRDRSRGRILTDDMANSIAGLGSVFVDDDNVWGADASESASRAAIDAHYGAARTWDYYLRVHHRRGINGAGFQMISRVHYGVGYSNAFWNGSYMTYGDGDGVTFRPLVSIDVAGHEITHGVTEHTANLVYEGESGAANESFSDIFGSAIEFFSDRPNRPGDYLIGEDVYLSSDVRPGFRNLRNPAEDGDPAHYSKRKFRGRCLPSAANDNCGVHSNSGIQNNAFYLLAEGGRNRVSDMRVRGIGRRRAERIFYRALTVYLTPRSDFHDVRVACLKAADDLFPGPRGRARSTSWRSTAKAWTAVGVR